MSRMWNAYAYHTVWTKYIPFLSKPIQCFFNRSTFRVLSHFFLTMPKIRIYYTSIKAERHDVLLKTATVTLQQYNNITTTYHFSGAKTQVRKRKKLWKTQLVSRQNQLARCVDCNCCNYSAFPCARPALFPSIFRNAKSATAFRVISWRNLHQCVAHTPSYALPIDPERSAHLLRSYTGRKRGSLRVSRSI